MKYFFKSFPLFFFWIFIFSSCKKEGIEAVSNSKTLASSVITTATLGPDEAKVEEKIIVLNKEESMPVWLYGKASSNTIIVMVHGGPGIEVMDYRNFNQGLAFRRLENNYIVAYWQQRASGQSQGPDKPSYYTIPQYAEDCDVVVDKLRAKYPGKKIILMGHSWGGMLSSYYLRTSARRAKIAAWVDIDGVHNGKVIKQFCIEDLNTEASTQINLGKNINYWTDVKNLLLEEPGYANSISYSCIQYVSEVKIKVDLKDLTSSTQRASESNRKLSPVILSTDNNSYLKSYTLPTLVLWGKYDLSVSKKIRDQVLANSGSTMLVNKEFSASSHLPMFQEPDEFAETIENFIKKL